MRGTAKYSLIIDEYNFSTTNNLNLFEKFDIFGCRKLTTIVRVWTAGSLWSGRRNTTRSWNFTLECSAHNSTVDTETVGADIVAGYVVTIQINGAVLQTLAF